MLWIIAYGTILSALFVINHDAGMDFYFAYNRFVTLWSIFLTVRHLEFLVPLGIFSNLNLHSVNVIIVGHPLLSLEPNKVHDVILIH